MLWDGLASRTRHTTEISGLEEERERERERERDDIWQRIWMATREDYDVDEEYDEE